MSAKSYDCIILGGGIVGCALSYYLARDHGFSVLLYEKETLASGASGKAGGLISAQCWNDEDVQLVEESKKEYLRLSAENGSNIYEQTGGIRTVSTEDGIQGLKAMVERLRRNHVDLKMLEPRDLQEIYPGGEFEGILQALYTPTDAVVLPADLTQLYGRLSAEQGTRIEYGGGDAKLVRSEGGWSLNLGGEDLQGESLVVASGAWTKKVLSGLGLTAPLSPYLTRACLLKAGVEGSFPYFHDNDLDVYLRPFPGGDILAGDGTELLEVDPDRVDSPNDIGFLENIASFMGKRFPRWSGASLVASWRGVVTATPDRRPLLGKYLGQEGLFLATGFNGFGIMRAGGAAQRLADGIAKGDWGKLASCDPARFPLPHAPFPPAPGFTLT